MRFNELPTAAAVNDHSTNSTHSRESQQIRQMLDQRGFLVTDHQDQFDALSDAGNRWVIAHLNVTDGPGDTPAARIAAGGPEMSQVDIEVDMADLTDGQTGDLDLTEIAESCHQLTRYYDNTVASADREQAAAAPSTQTRADLERAADPEAPLGERYDILSRHADTLGISVESDPQDLRKNAETGMDEAAEETNRRNLRELMIKAQNELIQEQELAYDDPPAADDQRIQQLGDLVDAASLADRAPGEVLDAGNGRNQTPVVEEVIERSEELFSEAEELGIRTEAIPGEPEPAYDAGLAHTRQRLQQTATNATSEADRLAAKWESAPTPERRERWDYVNRLHDFSSRAALLAETPTTDPFDEHSAQVRQTVSALRGRLETHKVEYAHTGGDHEAIAIYPADDEPQDYRVMVCSADGGPLDNTGWHVGVERFDADEHGAATGLVVDQNWEVFTSYDDADAEQVPSQVIRGIDQVRDLADAPDQRLDVDLDQQAYQQAVASQAHLNQQSPSGPGL